VTGGDLATWVRDVLPDRVVAVETVRNRTWGVVLRVRTPDRVVYAKAPGPRGRHELALLDDIDRRHPGLVPTVLAVDRERSWLLLADHGAAMRDVLDGPGQVAATERYLPAYAAVQQSTVDLLPSWIAAGTPDRRVDRLPELVAARFDVGPAALADLERVCAELGDDAAIDHADAHGSNVFVSGDDVRLADWGDASITTPLATLHVPLTFVVPLLPAADRPAATRRLRDVYLEARGTGRDERERFAMAFWLGHVLRAISIFEECGLDDEEIPALLAAWERGRSVLGHGDEVLFAG
jgi:hypothetical protein